jgi:hemerythrin superfamily protein
MAPRKAGSRAKSTRGSRAKDAIALLKADHREVEKLFKKFQGLGERAIKTKGTVVQKVCTDLQIHDVLEKEHLYPISLRIDPKLVKHALDEHREVNELIEQIKGTEPDDDRMDGLMKKLIADVKDHVKDEEKKLFPELQNAFDKDTFKAMGKQMTELKRQLLAEKRRTAA